MELTPQLLTDEIDFRIAVRGYDRHEVDDFLERVAVAVGQLQSQLTKAVARAKTAEARVAELEGASTVAKPTTSTPEPTPEAPRETEPVGSDERDAVAPLDVTTPKAPPSAPVPAVAGEEDLNEELRRTLVLAQRTADTAIREAHEEARQIVEGANEEARRNREAAEAAHAKAREEAHGRLVAEIRELEATRESMRDDTVVLERYLGTERARVRETIQVLRRLVDDPESFRTGAVPELSGAATPAALGPAPASTAAESSEEAPADDGGDDSAAVGSVPSETDVPDSPAEKPDDRADADGQGTEPPPLAQRVPGATAADEAGPSDSEEVGTPDADAPAHDGPTTDEAPSDAASSGAAASDAAPGDAAPGDAAPGDAAPSGATASESEELGQLFSSSDSTKDWRAAGADRGDQGPHTQPVAAARFEEESDEAFLAELRRAMNDDEPLGPDEKP